VADLEQHLGIALIEMKVEALRGARQALARLVSGDYGYCAECRGLFTNQRRSRRANSSISAGATSDKTQYRIPAWVHWIQL
jgi:hypothetical protein